MGIKGLAKLLSEEAPGCVKEVSLSSLHGRKIAIDASMAIYQFLIAVRSGGPNNAAAMLTNEKGETTSHIQGLFNRTIRFLTEGIRPVYVFDGKPPQFKSCELNKRRDKRAKAEAELKKAQEDGNVEEEEKQMKRLVRAGTKENEDCQRLLRLMGVPIVLAPCEAEAQAARLAQKGYVWAVGTEDMDALTFQAPILLRKMTFANASKSDIQQMDYAKAIQELELTHDQFVDLCILLGCDYCDSIKGIGPKTALKLIRQHGCIETILKNIDRNKFIVPDSWVPNEKKIENSKGSDDEYDTDKENNEASDAAKSKNESDEDEDLIPVYVEARRLFNHHDVLDTVDLKWAECQVEELTKFLVDEMGFNPERVKANIEKLQKAHKSTAKPQMRMDSFFKAIPTTTTNSNKRKPAESEKQAAKGKKMKGGANAAKFRKK